MTLRLLILGLFVWLPTCYAQECKAPMLLFPAPGSAGVALDTEIRWEAVEGVPGYLLSLGTTPGGTELLNRQQMGNATRYVPPEGLPEFTRVYVTIVLYFFEEGIPEVYCNSDSFVTAAVTEPPACSSLLTPTDGSTGVSTKSLIRWNYVPGASAYRIEMGTSPGSADLYEETFQERLTFLPPDDLPEDQRIYLRIIPLNRFGEASDCPEYSFTTGKIGEVPGCSRLIYPRDGDTDVPLNPELQWEEVPGATGYRVSIGNSPFTSEILSNATFYDTSTRVIDFEANRSFFISIIPFNEAGEALGCRQESFSTQLGCGPYYDPNTGELVNHFPTTSLPDTLAICAGAPEFYSAPDLADGYRWYAIGNDGSTRLLGEAREILLQDEGEYLYEAYNRRGNDLECPVTKSFRVVASGIPRDIQVEVNREGERLRITALASGIGNYEYSLEGPEGPWQQEGSFTGLLDRSYTLWVRDRNGCGVVERPLTETLLLSGFPKFFTPNGDGTNEYWQFRPAAGNRLQVKRIEIFDRYGRLLASLRPGDKGWDGKISGRNLPASNYWFQATLGDGSLVTGYFLLKR